MRILLLAIETLLLFAVRPSDALTIRGDELWRSNRTCPPGWYAADADDSTWLAVAYPWYHHWPQEWAPDPTARFFWGQEPSNNTCVRRHFRLDVVPVSPAMAHISVDDDYELYLNGSLVGASNGQPQMPGGTYDVSRLLRAGDNVIAVRLIDHGGSMGALFSLTIPGVPDASLTWFQVKLRVVPWLQFAAVALLIAAIGSIVARLRIVAARPIGSLSPFTLVLLTALLASACQTVLATQVFYRGMTEFIGLATSARDYPLAHWNWGALAMATTLFLLLVVLCSRSVAPPESALTRRSEMLTLGAILLVALILRAYRVDSIPVGFYQDEASNGNDAFDLLHFYRETGVQVWSDRCGGRPTLFLYLVGICVHLFGSSYGSLKIIPVIFGVVAVAAIYALGRVAFGPREALWAAFFLAVSRWHIHYSRMAWEAICVPAFSTAGFALLLHGLRRERGGLSVMAGALVLSGGLYTYASYRAIPVIAVLFLLTILLSSDARLIVRREKVTALVAGALLAAIAATPLALFAWREPRLYWGHYKDVSIITYLTYFGTPMPWVHMLGKALLSFNAEGDALIRHNLPFAPHLDVITGAFFLVGTASAVWAWRQLGVRLLWIWFIIFVGLTTMTREIPHATRQLGLVPVAALFAAVGVTRLLALLTPTLRGSTSRVLIASLVLSVAGLNSYQYFVIEANDPTADEMLDFTGRTLCEYLRQRSGVDVYWTADIGFWAGGQCVFLARGRYTDNELTFDRARNPASLCHDRPAIAVVGREFLEDHRAEISSAADGRPVLAFSTDPIVQRDREGKVLYYLYDFCAPGALEKDHATIRTTLPPF